MKETEKKKQTMEKILSNELLDDRTSNFFPDEYKIIKKYPLVPPFSYANILYNEQKSHHQYFVDEIKPTRHELNIYNSLYSLVEESLDTVDTVNADVEFESHLDHIIEKNDILFHQNALASVEKVKYFLKRDILGFGQIDSLMNDPNIEDVSCSGVDIPLYIWHRTYDSIPTNVQFTSEQKLDTFISKIVFRSGKHVSTAHPISDLAIEGNHRISVLYKKEITPRGTSFTIRKFKEDPYTMIDLINFGTVDLDTAAYLWLLVEAKLSVIVIGATGGGKTTMLNAIAGLVSQNDKIFSVEDVAEINIPHDNWFALVSRTGFGLNGEGEIGLYDLIKSGVRHRPDYIVVGEIRGSEAYVMFQAMATGHGGLCTMHADSFESASKRLQQKPMDIPPAYIPLMNCAIVVKRVHDKTTGQSVRRAMAVEEVVNPETPHTVFSWNAQYDHFDNTLQESKNLQKVAERTGKDFKEIIREHGVRKQILKWMMSHNIREHKQVSEFIGKYYRDPESVLQKISYGGY